MIVKCIEKKKQNQETTYDNLTIGKEYLVLALEFYNSTLPFSSFVGDYVIYRIEGNDGNVMPYPAKSFEIVSTRIPSNWIIFRNSEDMYSILPKSWARDYFWDDFYNDEYNAVQAFESEIEKIKKEEN